VGIHQETARRVVPVLVGEDTVEDKDLLALRVGMLREGAAQGIAPHTGPRPVLATLSVKRLTPDSAAGARLPVQPPVSTSIHRIRSELMSARGSGTGGAMSEFRCSLSIWGSSLRPGLGSAASRGGK
jgi:hypothetical protein